MSEFYYSVLIFFNNFFFRKGNRPAGEFAFAETELLAGLAAGDTTAAFGQRVQLVSLDAFETPGAAADGVGADRLGAERRRFLAGPGSVALAAQVDAQRAASVGDRFGRISRRRDFQTVLLHVQREDGELRRRQSTWCRSRP